MKNLKRFWEDLRSQKMTHLPQVPKNSVRNVQTKALDPKSQSSGVTYILPPSQSLTTQKPCLKQEAGESSMFFANQETGRFL